MQAWLPPPARNLLRLPFLCDLISGILGFQIKTGKEELFFFPPPLVLEEIRASIGRLSQMYYVADKRFLNETEHVLNPLCQNTS